MTATTLTQYNWTLLRRAKRGHKFFKDENSGRVSICDYSGRLPEHTHDGPLWIDESRDIQVGNFLFVPVKDDKGKDAVVNVSPSDAAWIIAEFNFNIVLGGTRFECSKLEES